MKEGTNQLELLSAYIIVKSFADIYHPYLSPETLVDGCKNLQEKEYDKTLSLKDAMFCLYDATKTQNITTTELLEECDKMFTYVFGKDPNLNGNCIRAVQLATINRLKTPKESTFDEMWEKYLKKDFEDAKLEVTKVNVNETKGPGWSGTAYAITTKENLRKNMHLIKKHPIWKQFEHNHHFYKGENLTGETIMHRKDDETMLEGKNLICFLMHALLEETKEYSKWYWPIRMYCRENNMEANWHRPGHPLSMPKRITAKWVKLEDDCEDEVFIAEFKKRLKDVLDECVIAELRDEIA